MPNGQPENIHTSIIIWPEKIVLENIYIFFTNVCVHLHEVTNSEKGGHKFEGEWEGIYKKAWEEERKGINAPIKL